MKKFVLLVVVLSLVLSLSIGCARQQQPAPAPEPTPEPEVDEEDWADEELGEQDQDNIEELPPDEDEVPRPRTAEGVADGEYSGFSDRDERGNYGEVRLRVENEKIVEVEYFEYDGDDNIKSREGGYTYEEALEAFEELPRQLLETQNIDDVDTYTGATGTTNKFKTAAMNALVEGLEDGAEDMEQAEDGEDAETEEAEE